MANKLSIVVPLHNEAEGLETFHQRLLEVLKKSDLKPYEIIYVDDGSRDKTGEIVKKLRGHNAPVKLVSLSRNFGKESALAAGLTEASGQAVITIDGDGQHPLELIPEFVGAWRQGAQVVIGVRSNQQPGLVKRWLSGFFYAIFNKLADQPLIPGSTDLRLLDREVLQAFLRLHETDRISRGLVDWLGFERQLVYFEVQPRLTGAASYSQRKLWQLAANSFVSLTPKPLYLFGYLGVFITVGAFVLGVTVFIEQVLFSDPLRWRFTGTAMLGILILFLVGILLMAQGMLSLYITHIHSQTKKRPLYVINQARSIGLSKDE